VTGRRARRRKQVLDDVRKTRGYGKLKEEALDCAHWRTGFGRGYTHVARHTTECMNSLKLWLICFH